LLAALACALSILTCRVALPFDDLLFWCGACASLVT